MKKVLHFINGTYTASLDEDEIANINPSSGDVYAHITRGNAKDIDLAFTAAQAAFPKWSNTPVQERSRILNRLADLIEANLEDLAKAEAIDNGKPLSLASQIDIPRAAANFRFFAQAITQFSTEAHESKGLHTINFTLRQPHGVVGCISPWNLPLYLFTWKIAPAIAAGNTVLAKPSEVTPMTAYLLGKLCNQAGLPKGVLNILQGYGHEVGQAIIAHPQIKAISFTGGTSTGQHIAKTAAPLFKKLSLELGGKNPNLIFADCNYEQMLKNTVRSSFANQGQICLCGSRILVEASIYKKFKQDFIKQTKALKIGHPLDKHTQVGALVSKQHLEKIEAYVKIAKAEGGSILCGGKPYQHPDYPKGFYFEPTIIEVQSNQCRINQEEIFGPIVSLMPFKDEAEALALANDSKYGLSASVWTSNLDRSMRLSQELQTGIVWVNTWLNRDLRTPFGGTKQSGLGREGGFEALRFFTEPKNVCITYKP